MRRHRRVRRLRPELPLAAWDRLRLGLIAQLRERPIFAELGRRRAAGSRWSSVSARRPCWTRSALMRWATWSDTGSAARADAAWTTKAKNAVTAIRAIAGRRSGGCVGNTGGPSLSAPTGLAGGLALKEMRSALDGQGLSPLRLGSPAPRSQRGLGDVRQQSTQSSGGPSSDIRPRPTRSPFLRVVLPTAFRKL